MEDKIINLTPHPVVVLCDGQQHSLAPLLPTPRVAVRRVQTGTLHGIPLSRIVYGHVENLPGSAPGRYYLVSRIVAEALPQRKDLLFPDDLVRDAHGNVVGCRAFGHIWPADGACSQSIPALPAQ
ncbi:MAG: hypothetical protein KJ052_12020 [Candidatus Hydrogenedentes bacterium]|nr:hypothetical protein [Candidatus Hydrogenedentota bacterium]